MVEPVNVVGGGGLNRKVDIQTLFSELSNRNKIKADFTDENRWQLVIEFDEAGKILVYRTGSYIIRGGSSFDTLETTKELWFRLLKKENIVDDLSSIEYSLQNVVFSGDLEQSIDLAVSAVELGINNTEYEPEQFPGLIYRPDGYSAVILIFSSGKVIITGGTKQEDAEAVLRHVQNKLNNE